jgi:hypothetical protein
MVAVRAVEQYGLENVVLQTANVKVEDTDNWRFAVEVFKYLGRPKWEILADGRTPMQVGRDLKCVPNDRMAVCSRVLKRDLIRAHLDANYDPAECVVMLGFDWTEEHRLKKSEPHWAPWTIAAPLMEEPLMEKPVMLDWFRERGIEPPRLYGMGFSHANCGGACVRGGHASWALLWEKRPEVYLKWEGEEEETRGMLGKDVSILKDRRGGTTRPITLRRFRQERLPGGDYDVDDWGACGCFMGEDE